MTPTYTFEEIIEMIRNAETLGQLHIIAMVVEDDKKRYCLFHLRLISEAISIAKGLLPAPLPNFPKGCR